MKQYKKAVVLGADNNYMDKVETLVKSVSVHNHNVRFYVLNDDFPKEWFQIIQRHLDVIGSEIINVQITSHGLRDFSLPSAHLNYATFFRYFIAEHVVEDQILYLDSDMIVTECLNELFEKQIDNYPLAAVRDIGNLKSSFNAGMLLINAKYWREHNVAKKLLELTKEYHETDYGDQGILNRLFKDKWYPLDKRFNLMVGYDNEYHLSGNWNWFDSEYRDGKKVPTVIHFTGLKPWSQITLSRFRKIWWFYYGLPWSDVVQHNDIVNRSLYELINFPKFSTCIFTNSASMENIEYLIKSFPEVEFTILAHSYFAPEVYSLQRFTNLRLYPNFNPFNAEEVLNKMDFYLDINHADEIYDIINKVKEKGKPIFGFTNTSHDYTDYSQVYEISDVDRMIEDIRKFLIK